jgi:hypothetical protein
MAITAKIAISVDGIDSESTMNSGIVAHVEKIATLTTSFVESFTTEIPNNTAAFSIKAPAGIGAGVTNVNYLLLFTYNVAETVTPKCQVVVDTVACVANQWHGGMYTSTITVATTSLTYPVKVQVLYFKAY